MKAIEQASIFTSSLSVTAINMSARSAPASASVVGFDASPFTVLMSRRSCNCRNAVSELSTTVTSFFSSVRCSVSDPPTCPAPNIMMFTVKPIPHLSLVAFTLANGTPISSELQTKRGAQMINLLKEGFYKE